MNEETMRTLTDRLQKECCNLAGIVISHEGMICYEHYENGCHKDSTLHVYSVTKSVVSILIGIAIDQGAIQSVDQKIMDFYPDYSIEKNALIQQITIKDLLTMRIPYQLEQDAYEAYFTSEDWIRFAMDHIDDSDTMASFHYAPLIGLDLLTGILQRATGTTVLEYAREYLFAPLAIHVKDHVIFHSEEEHMTFVNTSTISGWVLGPKGVQSAGWGLTLNAMDMVKIAQLYLKEGVWKGKQIVSADWIKASTKEHNRWQETNLPYGYLWWITKDGFAAMGDGGNVIYVNSKKQLAVSMVCFFAPDVFDRIDWIQANIEPLFERKR